MHIFSDKDRAQLAEIRHAWFSLIVFAALFSGQILIDASLEHKWRILVAVIALTLWHIIRPWRYGGLSEKSRHSVRSFGALAVCIGPVLVAIQFNR